MLKATSTIRNILAFIADQNPTAEAKIFNGRQWIAIEFHVLSGCTILSHGDVCYWPGSQRVEAAVRAYQGASTLSVTADSTRETFQEDRDCFEKILRKITGKSISEMLGAELEVAA